MSDFMKKALWQYYAIVLVIFVAVLVWGLSGILWGGGLMFWRLTYYAIFPCTAGALGVVLGIKNARYKWLCPFYSGGLSYIASIVLFRGPVVLLLGASYFVFPFLAAIIGLGLGMIIWKARSSTKIKLKKITIVALMVVGIVAFIHIAHAFTLDRIIQYTEISFHSPSLAPELDGYRMAFIVDIHYMSERRLSGIVDELNQQELDLLVLGGDLAMNSAGMRKTVEILSQVETTDGIFGVEGNHDNYIWLFAAMEEHGITPLSNSGYYVREGLFIAGVHDLWNRSPNVAEAVASAQPDDFVLLISHNPDVSMRQDTAGVDLVLSGHTHGGQVTFFGIWAPYFTFTNNITDYGRRFRSGWAESRDGTPVFTSRGAGEYFPRVFSRPEVVIVTLSL